MDGPRDYHTKWNKPEKDKYHIILLICGIEENDDTNALIKQKQTHKYRFFLKSKKTIVTRGESREKDKLGVWD